LLIDPVGEGEVLTILENVDMPFSSPPKGLPRSNDSPHRLFAHLKSRFLLIDFPPLLSPFPETRLRK